MVKSNLIFVLLIMFVVSLLVAYAFYLIPFSLLIFFSLIKIGIFYYVLDHSLRKFPINDKISLSSIGVLSVMIIIALPHMLNYYDLLNNGYEIKNVLDYITLASQQAEYSPIYWFGDGISGIIPFFLFEGIESFILIAGLVGVSISFASESMKEIKKDDYKQTKKIKNNFIIHKIRNSNMKMGSKDFIIALLLIAIVFLGYLIQKPSEPQIETITKYKCYDGQIVDSEDLCPEIVEKALLDTIIESWGENIYDPDEILFGIYIYNYGNVEAKNVEVECRVWESDEEGYVEDYDRVILIASKMVGSIASTSYEYKEITAKSTGLNPENHIAMCHITSCDNCEMIRERIPEFIEYFIETGFI